MKQKFHLKAVLIVLMAFTVSSCASLSPEKTDDELVQQQQRFDECYVTATHKSEQAVTGANPALYFAAGKALQACLEDASVSFEITHSDQAFEASALTVMNFIKAGELETATQQFQHLQSTYPQQDLYFSDGTSFVDSVHLLMGEAPVTAPDRGSLVNATAALKSEIRRAHYWQTH